MRNCYQILGIHKRDNFDEIQEGFSKKLSELQDYYDKYTNIKGTQETYQEQERELNEHYQREIKKIAEAREILSNNFTKDAYNIGIEHGYYKGEEKTHRNTRKGILREINMEPKQNLYDILEIRPLADQKQIEEGFMNQLKVLRELNKETENICHAGVVINQKMKVAHEILEAYMILTDRNRKKDYDLGFKHGLREREMCNREFLI